MRHPLGFSEDFLTNSFLKNISLNPFKRVTKIYKNCFVTKQQKGDLIIFFFRESKIAHFLAITINSIFDEILLQRHMPQHEINPKKWIDRYSDYLFNYTITRVSDRETAQDLISETFLAGLKSMKNFKGEASERTWLTSILKRKIIDLYRKNNSKKGQAEVHISYKDDQSEGDWLEERVADPYAKTPEDSIENNELKDAIFNCLAKLPERQALLFKMKTIDNFDTDAICNQFDITASNLWVIIHRARTAMAECMEDNWIN